MDYILPASVYSSPPRLGRGRQLNTIIEDHEEASYGKSDSDTTVIGRPRALDQKHFLTAPQKKAWHAHPSSPVSVISSEGGDDVRTPCSNRSSYTDSDAGTVFSDSCPSLTGSNASDSTTIMTGSSRSSIASRSSRNRYPALIIPRSSWGSVDEKIKHISFGMSPSTKIMLTPDVLGSLPLHVPELEDAPSLADTGSIRSESPCVASARSMPVTPDLHSGEVPEGHPWGGNGSVLNTPLEIALDDHHSILLSPADAYPSRHQSMAQSVDWNDLMTHFPRIPGATLQEHTPARSDMPRSQSLMMLPGDAGVQLPASALDVLRALNTAPSETSESSVHEEMQERAPQLEQQRPKSFSGETPISEYSFSQLSIPSPGGFFSSLKAGSRRTWASPRTRGSSPPPPSSTTAENFYNAPWTQQSKETETVLEIPDELHDDGPATARQPVFESNIKTPTETSDLYGGQSSQSNTSKTRDLRSGSHEYEESYEEGLKQAAEVHRDRTNHWLAAQTSYLAALRDTNPLNDPADYPSSAGPVCPEEYMRKVSVDDDMKAAQFLQEARKSVSLDIAESKASKTSSPREPLFLEAFNFIKSEAKRLDSFLQSSVRLQSVQATRIALPRLHVQSLLNDHSSKTLISQHSRPKYRGPFSQNPRATGIFTQTPEQELFATLERQQHALAAILPSTWAVDAQSKILWNGRLLACDSASQRLTRKSTSVENNSKPLRILDLGGNATASWAWAAASRWSTAKVYTVQSKQQVDVAATPIDKEASTRPLNPANHRVVNVPAFWQLPFKSNYFDVVSARTLHMYLRSAPVPGVPSIDEWDLTLKECMRVLKPGGVLDFFVMDSGVSGALPTDRASVNLSPNAMTSANASATTVTDRDKRKADAVIAELRSGLSKRGYDQDGGCSRLMTRLKKEGFVGMKRQWIGLPMGRGVDPNCTIYKPHSRSSSCMSTSAAAAFKSPTSATFQKADAAAEASYKSYFNADGTKPKPFRLAPRPISEVSTVSKIVDQYLHCEAVQGPVGSTQDVADMSSLLGEMLWEEWLVRLRLETGVRTGDVLNGVNEVFSEWRQSGRAAWKGIVGWARKPTRSEAKEIEARAWKEEGKVPSPKQRVSVGFDVSEVIVPCQPNRCEIDQSPRFELEDTQTCVVEAGRGLKIDTAAVVAAQVAVAPPARSERFFSPTQPQQPQSQLYSIQQYQPQSYQQYQQPQQRYHPQYQYTSSSQYSSYYQPQSQRTSQIFSYPPPPQQQQQYQPALYQYRPQDYHRQSFASTSTVQRQQFPYTQPSFASSSSYHHHHQAINMTVVRRNDSTASREFSQSAIERGEVMEIPVMIVD